MKTRFYYTMAETMKLTEDEEQFVTINSPLFMYLVMEGTANVGGLGLYVNTMLDEDVVTDTTYSKAVMQHYIWNMYYNEKVMYVDVEHPKYEGVTKPLVTSPEFIKARKEFAGKIWAWVKESQERYEKLAALYTGQMANLLNQIKTNSISKYNDTPQNDNNQFATDNYVSNITQNEAGTDGATPIARLEEIRRLLHSVYGEWAKEFGKFTIEE